jgi:hypothetical protein
VRRAPTPRNSLSNRSGRRPVQRLFEPSALSLTASLPVSMVRSGVEPEDSRRTTAWFSVTHAFEAVLLVHALAEHARGARNTALALVVACAFVKASMAYVYGLLLLALFGREIWRKTRRVYSGLATRARTRCGNWIALRGGAAGLLWCTRFACRADPKRGQKDYALMNYGFFRGVGRNFWARQGATLNYYLGRFAGSWLVCTALLVTANVTALIRASSRHAGDALDTRREILAAAYVSRYWRP